MTTHFEEIKAYIGFGGEDVARLRGLHDVAAPHFERLADHFFEVLARHPAALDAIRGSAVQVAQLKRALVEWMASALLGPYDEAYYERSARIGRRHVAIALPQQYVFAAMNILRLDFRRLIECHYADDVAAERAVGDAIDRLLDLELAIMMRSYQEDTEARLVRRERRVQEERLAAMQTLTAGLAHEVRNPLNAARLQLELLERRLRRSSEDPKLLEPTALVHDEINRLSTLLHEFLEFARPTSLAIGDHDLSEIARSVVELMRPMATEHKVALSVADRSEAVIAAIDASKIHQVILNMVRNAVEAVAGGGTVEVEVVAVDGDAVRVLVRDDGPGIPGEILERIYEPFFTTKQGGTGLGLAICHSLVAMHGGELAVRTQGGTEFEIRLPRRAETAD